MNTNVFKRKTKVINDDDTIEILGDAEEIHDDKEKIKTINQEHLKKNNIIKHTENEKKNHLQSPIPPKGITEKTSEAISTNSEKKLSQIKSQIKLGTKPKQDHDEKSKEKNGSAKMIEKTVESGKNKHASKPIPQPKNKLTNKKRKRDSSDSESSNSEGSESEDSSYEENEESSSSESSSESEKSASIKKPSKKEKIRSTSVKKKIKNETHSEKLKPKKKEHEQKEKKVLKTKASLVYQLLRRWWYALPKWPPEGYDIRYEYAFIIYSPGLAERKLRAINRSEWKIEPNVDNKGFTKCVELDGYKYVFVDNLGKFHDLRPSETKPSYNNFMKKTEKELYVLLIKAMKNQLSISESEIDQCTRNSLKEELKLVEWNYKQQFGEINS